MNRINNIGYDGTGVHSGVGRPKNATIRTDAAPYRLSHVAPSAAIDKAFHRTYSGSPLSRLKRELRGIAGAWKRGQ